MSLTDGKKYTFEALMANTDMSTSSSSHLSNILALLDMDPLTTGGDHLMQIDVFAQDRLPISFASDRFKRKFGAVEKLEPFTNWITDSEAFVQWLISRANDIYSGLRKPGVEEYGSLPIQQRGERRKGSNGAPEPRVIAALFPDPAGPRVVYRISLRIGVRSTAGGESMSVTSSISSERAVTQAATLSSTSASGEGVGGKPVLKL